VYGKERDCQKSIGIKTIALLSAEAVILPPYMIYIPDKAGGLKAVPSRSPITVRVIGCRSGAFLVRPVGKTNIRCFDCSLQMVARCASKFINKRMV
jgi:hypothetical protein